MRSCISSKDSKRQQQRMRDFAIERFYAKHEFSAPYQLSCSDCEPLKMSEALEIVKSNEKCNKLWNNLSLSYTETEGHPTLREKIAKTYNSVVNPEDILVVVPEEGIYCFMKTFLKPNDEVIVTWPAYQSLHEVARSIGCKIVQWEFEIQNNPKTGFGEPVFNLETFKSLVTSKTSLIVINFPHNPTGFIPSLQNAKKIVEICNKNSIFLFSDEIYHPLVTNEEFRIPSFATLYKNCVVLSGFSKTMNMPGIRLGWLVIKDEALLKKVVSYKDYTTICPPAPSEILGIAALKAREELVSKNQELINSNLAFLKNFCKETNLFEFYQPRGGSILFPKMLVDDVDTYCETLIKEKGVVIVTESVFTGNEEQATRKSSRVRLGLGRKDFKEVLLKLKISENTQ